MSTALRLDSSTPGACELCSGADYRRLFEKSGYGLFRCEGCGLVLAHPRPSAKDLQPAYTDGKVGAGVPKGDQEEYERYAARYRPFLELVRQYCRPCRILDVGCWSGQFLGELGASWDRYGVELSESASSHARDHYRLNVLTGTIHDVQYPHGYFQAVTMWDIIEHVAEPKRDLQKATDLLSSGGFLFLSTPDWECFEGRIMGREWPVITPPGHLTYFTKSTISRLFALVGLELIFWRRTELPGYLPKFEIPRIGSLTINRFSEFATKRFGIRLGSTMKVVGRKPDVAQC